LRRIFNDGRFAERVASGELRRVVVRSRPVPKEKGIRNWIPGTESQEIRYYDREDNLIAKTHCYQRPDNLLAASGTEDPKRVVQDGVMYILQLPDEVVG
jgi:hypothetical protein